MEAAIQIAKAAEERKEEIENTRNIPSDLITQMKSLSLPRLWVAKEYGGVQMSIHQVMKLWQRMAYHSGSLAWVSSVTNCSSLISGYLPHEMALAIFGDQQSMVGGFAGPAGSALSTHGGLQVTGSWAWGSAISHCTHIIGGVKLIKDGNMVGAGVSFLEPSDVTLLDNWHVIGMKGTHSIDYAVKNLFVPNDRWIPFPPSKPVINEPLYRFSFLGALALSVAVIGLGLAERAHDEIILLLKNKVALGDQKPLSKQAIIQDKTGRISGNLLAAESLFYTTILEAQNATETRLATTAIKAKVRLAACTCTQLCLSVVRDAYELAGGSAIWNANKLEELHRDMHVVSQHGMASNANYRVTGSVRLGNKVPLFLL